MKATPSQESNSLFENQHHGKCLKYFSTWWLMTESSGRQTEWPSIFQTGLLCCLAERILNCYGKHNKIVLSPLGTSIKQAISPRLPVLGANIANHALLCCTIYYMIAIYQNKANKQINNQNGIYRRKFINPPSVAKQGIKKNHKQKTKKVILVYFYCRMYLCLSLYCCFAARLCPLFHLLCVHATSAPLQLQVTVKQTHTEWSIGKTGWVKNNVTTR